MSYLQGIKKNIPLRKAIILLEGLCLAFLAAPQTIAAIEVDEGEAIECASLLRHQRENFNIRRNVTGEENGITVYKIFVTFKDPDLRSSLARSVSQSNHDLNRVPGIAFGGPGYLDTLAVEDFSRFYRKIKEQIRLTLRRKWRVRDTLVFSGHGIGSLAASVIAAKLKYDLQQDQQVTPVIKVVNFSAFPHADQDTANGIQALIGADNMLNFYSQTNLAWIFHTYLRSHGVESLHPGRQIIIKTSTNLFDKIMENSLMENGLVVAYAAVLGGSLFYDFLNPFNNPEEKADLQNESILDKRKAMLHSLYTIFGCTASLMVIGIKSQYNVPENVSISSSYRNYYPPLNR